MGFALIVEHIDLGSTYSTCRSASISDAMGVFHPYLCETKLFFISLCIKKTLIPALS